MKNEKYIFIYRSGPNFQRAKCHIKNLRNQAHAEAFAEGLRKAGATNVKYSLEVA